MFRKILWQILSLSRLPIVVMAHLSIINVSDAAPQKKRYILPMPEKLPSGGRVRVQTDFSGGSWDWNHDGHRIPSEVLHAIHRGFYRINSDGTLEGDLVDDQIVSEDLKTWTFYFKDQVLWSDGHPFTARDAATGLLRAAEALAPSPPDAVSKIEGFREFHSLRSTTLAGVRIKSDDTLEIILRDPDAEFPLKLLDPRTFPVRSDLVAAHSNYGFQPSQMAFLGRWIPTENYASLRAKLRKNEKNPESKSSSFSEIELWYLPGTRLSAELFKRNHLDILLTSGLEDSSDGKQSPPSSSLVYLSISPQMKEKCSNICIDVLSRRINRKGLIELRPANSLIPPEMWNAQQLGVFTQEAETQTTPMEAKLPPFSLKINKSNLSAEKVAVLEKIAMQLNTDFAMKILRTSTTETPDLTLYWTEADSPAIDSFIYKIIGADSKKFIKDWNALAAQSDARKISLYEYSRSILITDPKVIPLGWGLKHYRFKRYIDTLPF